MLAGVPGGVLPPLGQTVPDVIVEAAARWDGGAAGDVHGAGVGNWGVGGSQDGVAGVDGGRVAESEAWLLFRFCTAWWSISFCCLVVVLCFGDFGRLIAKSCGTAGRAHVT